MVDWFVLAHKSGCLVLFLLTQMASYFVLAHTKWLVGVCLLTEIVGWFVLFFFFLLLFHNVGLCPHREYEAQRTFEQISSAQILCMDCPTKMVTLIYLFCNHILKMYSIHALFTVKIMYCVLLAT